LSQFLRQHYQFRYNFGCIGNRWPEGCRWRMKPQRLFRPATP
jgi:hypothetical protein